MNELLRHPFPPCPKPATTQVADGFPRRAWTAEDVQRMIDAGIIDAEEPFELVGGEIVAKRQKGILHENLKRALNLYWGKVRPDSLQFVPESPLRLGPHDEPEPDFFVFAAATPMQDVRGPNVLLVVEISDSSLAYDGSVKLRRYAAQGVREVWIVNARDRVTTVFREPTETGYARRAEFAGEERLVPLFAPELALRFADLA